MLSLVTGSSSSPAGEFSRLGCEAQYRWALACTRHLPDTRVPREDFMEGGTSCGPPGMEGELVQVGTGGPGDLTGFMHLL